MKNDENIAVDFYQELLDAADKAKSAISWIRELQSRIKELEDRLSEDFTSKKVAEVSTERRMPHVLDGWPKAYADFPWLEVEEESACVYCGENHDAGSLLRQDPAGWVCMNCVVCARRERQSGSR